MNKVILAVLVSTAGLCAGTAHAGNVSWSVGISAPGVGTVISNVPAYPVPVYVQAPSYATAYAPVYAPVPAYGPGYRPGYAVISAPVAYPRYGVRPRVLPVVYWRGHDGHRWDPRWQPRHGHDDRGQHHHGRHD